MAANKTQRVFAARLSGTPVFDPIGEKVGFVYDVVVLFGLRGAPRAVGLVVEVAGKRRVFLPLTRVTSISNGQVITTGLVNMRRFARRDAETLVLGELLDQTVTLRSSGEPVTIVDAAIEPLRGKEWELGALYVRTAKRTAGGHRSMIVAVHDVNGLMESVLGSGAESILAQIGSLKPADVADVLRDLPPARMKAIASQLADSRLADVLEEMGDDDRLLIVSGMDADRAADVLDEMQPDDAADLVAELPTDQAELLLEKMEPEEARDVRRLLTYQDRTAGGLMTTEPIILPPEGTVAEALASARRADIPPALASMIFICRPPLETPTGVFLGVVHLQRALREPPSTSLGSILDTDVEVLVPSDGIGRITRLLATYNMTALPVVVEDLLVGAVSVDDVLDHLLPDDWRDADETETDDAVEAQHG